MKWIITTAFEAVIGGSNPSGCTAIKIHHSLEWCIFIVRIMGIRRVFKKSELLHFLRNPGSGGELFPVCEANAETIRRKRNPSGCTTLDIFKMKIRKEPLVSDSISMCNLEEKSYFCDSNFFCEVVEQFQVTVGRILICCTNHSANSTRGA